MSDCDTELAPQLAEAWRSAIADHPWTYVRTRTAYGLALMGLYGPV